MLIGNLTKGVMLTLGAVKCVALVGVFASFGLVGGSIAKAEKPIACDGINLIEKLKSENPDAYARILDQASAVKHGANKYFKLERDGFQVSYLFGTMHMADPKIATLPESVKDAIKNSDQLVIESVGALDPNTAQQEMAKLGHLTLLKSGSLRDLVADDLEDELEEEVSKRGLPMMLADRMQPWLISTMVSLPLCEMQRKQAGSKVLDAELADFAKSQGKEIKGLETVAEQLEAMASLPQEYHVSALEEALAGGSLKEDMIETLKVTYLEGNMGIVFPLMRELAPQSYSGEGAAQFQSALIQKRNKVMLDRVLPILQTGATFVAVGALHLPGDDGLVNLLEAEGFQVTPLDNGPING